MLKSVLHKLFVIKLVVAFSFIAATAQGANEFSNKWYSHVNTQSPAKYISVLKGHFKTSEDHKLIHDSFNELFKDKGKMKWQPHNNGAGFWYNDKQVFVLDSYGSTWVSINGTKVNTAKGVSFKKVMQDFEKVAKAKKFSMQGLFINEADAIIPFIIGGALAVVGLSAAHAHAQTPEGQRQHTMFRRGVRCDSERRLSTDRRNSMIARNFRSNGPFNTSVGNNHQRFSETCVSGYVDGRTLARPNAIQVCKCISRKQQRCDNRGWNMTEAGAIEYCTTGFCQWSNGQGGICQPTTVPPGSGTPDVTPPYCNKRNECSGQPVPTPQPDPDPITPPYDSKSHTDI
ncbi:MAG: hypothetical protein HRT44_13385 [Bdellovibrionales bacterium]|nr:hypothetical protein [Bdellovibrionales bacterium]NQZ20231.1 hypothetical protein [Bdellovibrionales bacterium]